MEFLGLNVDGLARLKCLHFPSCGIALFVIKLIIFGLVFLCIFVREAKKAFEQFFFLPQFDSSK